MTTTVPIYLARVDHFISELADDIIANHLRQKKTLQCVSQTLPYSRGRTLHMCWSHCTHDVTWKRSF